jgi:hypothetical protein
MTLKRIGLVAMVVLSAGCNRQDADTLSRIGTNLASRAKAVAPLAKGDKLTAAMPGPSGDNAGKKSSDKRKSRDRP